jgi:hypothetical protein
MKRRISDAAIASIAADDQVRVSARAASTADNLQAQNVRRLATKPCVTPGDQGSSDADVAITREIRKSVVDQTASR